MQTKLSVTVLYGTVVMYAQHKCRIDQNNSCGEDRALLLPLRYSDIEARGTPLKRFETRQDSSSMHVLLAPLRYSWTNASFAKNSVSHVGLRRGSCTTAYSSAA